MHKNKKKLLDYIDYFEIQRLTQDHDLSIFEAECGGIYTDFLVKNAKKCDSERITTTYIITRKNANKTVCAYFSIFFYSITAKRMENIPAYIYSVGAIEIYQLAASVEFAKEYGHIVDFIVRAVVARAIAICKTHINLRYITVHADPEQGNEDIVKIYKSIGFKELDVASSDEESPETVFMLYDIWRTQNCIQKHGL